MLRNHTDHIKLYIFIRAIPGLFSVYFRSFSIKLMSTCPSSIWCWDSKQRPSEHKRPPITTTPGFLTRIRKYFLFIRSDALRPGLAEGEVCHQVHRHLSEDHHSGEHLLIMELFNRRKWRLISTQIVKFGYCPSWIISFVLVFN